MKLNQKGQGLIEYVILVALIGVGSIVVVRKLQATVNNNVSRVVDGLQSNPNRRNLPYIRVEEEDVRMKDFNNFMNGTTDHSN